MRENKKLDFETYSKRIYSYSRVLLFISLIAIELFILYDNTQKIFLVLTVELLITVNNAIKMWVFKKFKYKITCYVADTILFMVLTMITRSNFLATLYIIFLTEFYLSSQDFVLDFIIFICSLIIYCITFAVFSYFINHNSMSLWGIITACFNNIIILSIHFLVLNFAIFAYRKNKLTAAALKKLDESNKKLQKAYEELKAITVLEERQRIAKDIHDTAGHSITTVIMQTEAAKLTIDSDPVAAKNKIIAANLQAKHALDELRTSVHVLSGLKEHSSLKDEITSVIHESSDGTDIKIKSSVADITVSDAKGRLIVNSLREGISNGLRHGGATAFYFELAERNGEIFFLLSDNGCGADLSLVKEGLGLGGMKTRAEALGGKAEFFSEKGEGFEMKITLPENDKKEIES